jgi:hypothetical protein
VAQTILVSGATGVIGGRLVSLLSREGADIRALTRTPERITGRPRQGVTAVAWDGVHAPSDAVRGSAAVVHLAGEPVFAGRPSPTRRERIRASRVDSTNAFVETFASLPPEERPSTFVCASAVGIYGSRGDEFLDESAAPGEGFLADLCRDWEASARAAEASGVRVVSVRFGIVLAREGGALPEMARPARLGLGARLGSGRQWVPWVHIDDAVALVRICLREDGPSGPINAVAPEPVSNAQLTRSLAKALHRPAFLAVPGFLVRAALGDLAVELIGSRRVVPRVALEAGFHFAHSDIDEAIATELNG